MRSANLRETRLADAGVLGANFVQCLVLALCATTRHWTGQVNSHNQAALAGTAPAAGQRRD